MQSSTGFDAAIHNTALELTCNGVVAADADGVVVSANQRSGVLLGYPSPLGMQASVLFQALASRLADSRQWDGLQQRIAADPRLCARIELLLDNGDVFEVSTAPVANPADGRSGRLWMIKDISEHRHTLMRLREEEETFRSVVEQEVAGLCVIGQDGRMAYVNPAFARFFGRAREAIVGQPLLDFVPAEQCEQVRTLLAGHLAGRGDTVRLTYPIAGANGRGAHVLVQASAARYHGQPACAAIVLDITERKLAEQSLARTNRVLRTLSSGNEVVVRAGTERQLLDEMCRVLVEVGGYPVCWIGLANGRDGTGLRIEAWFQADHWPAMTQAVQQQMLRPGCAAPRAIAAGAATLGPDDAGCSVAFPFYIEGDGAGALVLCAERPDGFEPDDLRMLGELAGDLGHGLKALRAHAARDATAERLRNIMQATVQALATTLELRDPYTAGHQRRVAALSAEMARRMGLSDDAVEGIALAAVVHDVGKVRVPAEILTKPGRLTTLEYELVKMHARAGYEILKGIDFPWPVAQMVGQHHERMNGSGYPNGLRGDEILPGSRIIAVADVVETMMSHRPYRAALGEAAALAEIEQGKGTLYDADAVEACLALFRRQGFRLPEPHD